MAIEPLADVGSTDQSRTGVGSIESRVGKTTIPCGATLDGPIVDRIVPI